MRHLKTAVHPDLLNIENMKSISRQATRAIAIDGCQILLLYTERYDDYSLPGGGLNDGEDPIAGMIRELQEETGAQNIRNIDNYGIYEEFRPWYKSDADVMHMTSYCYVCQVDQNLGTPNMESHELQNGSRPVWINIYDAIGHNEQTMLHSHQKGLSIERETFLLRLIADELIDG